MRLLIARKGSLSCPLSMSNNLEYFELNIRIYYIIPMDCCNTFRDYNVCVCPSEVFKRVVDEVFKVPVVCELIPPEPLPEVIVDKFAPYESLYELTLTTTVDDPYELRMSLDKIVKSAMFEVKGYIACIELTKNSLPHIHALLFSTRKYIDGSKIKKLYKYRYECKRVRMPKNYYDYLNKEKNNPLVIDYCAKKGIPQIWE